MQNQTAELTELALGIIEKAKQLKSINSNHKALLWFTKIMDTATSRPLFERAFYRKFRGLDETDVDMCINYLCYLEDAIAEENKKAETTAAQKSKSLVLESIK